MARPVDGGSAHGPQPHRERGTEDPAEGEPIPPDKVDADPVLVVDDDPDTRAIISMVLRRAGYVVVEADSGEQALALTAGGRWSVVLLDRNLPGIEGTSVVARMRADRQTATIPVIMVTNRGDVVDRVSGLEAGADDYLVKPFDIDELLARVRAQIRGHTVWAEVVGRHLREHATMVHAAAVAARGASVGHAADILTRELTALPGMCGAAILEVIGDGIEVLAQQGRELLGFLAGDPHLPALGTYLSGRAAHGPWIELLPSPVNDLDPPALALAPIHADEAIVGLVAVGAAPGARPHEINELLRTVIDFGMVAGGLIGADLADSARRRQLAGRYTRISAERAFDIVFQPIVDLTQDLTVGYEALTRFHDGTPPEAGFKEAKGLGRGIELELATMRAAVAASSHVAPHTWISLNVSPRLLCETERLRDVLREVRGIAVLEISEHDPVDDYAALHDAVQRLGARIQLSVDDAGSGFASLAHILALRAEFVKLDRTWVHGIDADPTRQALVAGLVHFAGRTSSGLIAEGVETPAELDTLRTLGVDYAQGYLLGRPAPLDV